MQWNALIDPLVELGFQAVAIDLPAHGETPGKETSFIQAGETLLEILAEENPVAVVAHSFGAGAMTFASQTHPVPVVFAGGPAETLTVVDNFCKFLSIGPNIRERMMKKALVKVGMTLDEVNVGNMAANCTAPALAIHDPEDEEVSYEEAKAIMARWPDAKHVTLENVGHYRILWKPESKEAIMSFLSSTLVAPA